MNSTLSPSGAEAPLSELEDSPSRKLGRRLSRRQHPTPFMIDNIQIINPITYPGWDELILSTPNYSFFHSSTWAKVLRESYGYKPLYFTVFKNGGLSAVIPIMEVNSFLTGKRGVSLPFTDYCDPIVNGDIQFKDLLDYVIEYGKRRRWKSLEIRGGQNHFRSVSPSSNYLSHVIDLGENEEEIFYGFKDSVRRNIKKANREGVEVGIFNSLDSLKEFYRLNCLTRKEHGLPPQPYLFFENIYEHVIGKKQGHVVIASYKGKNIAGAIFFHFGEKAFYKYGASDLNYQHLRANNLVMWEAIKWFYQKGYKSLCLGRTEPENEGLRQFKSGWGTTEQQINYYRYDLNKGSFVTGSSKVTGFHNKIFRNTPIPILNRIGSILYKHVG